MKRKVLAALLCVTTVVTMGLTGCGKSSTDTGAGSASDGVGSATTDKVLRVGIECAYAPYNWTQEEETVANGDKAVKIANADGYAYGYDVKVAQMIADELGWDLEIYKSEWSSIFMGLENKTWDCVMSGFCYSEERDQTYDFTTTYYPRTIKAVVRDDAEWNGITKLSDFEGKKAKVTTQMGTNYVPYKDEVPGGESVTDYETSSECFMAVQNKTADIVILDRTTCQSALATMEGLKMLELDASDDFVAPEGTTNDCCIAFRESDSLRDTIQDAMDSMGWTTDNADQMNSLMDEMLTLQPSSN